MKYAQQSCDKEKKKKEKKGRTWEMKADFDKDKRVQEQKRGVGWWMVQKVIGQEINCWVLVRSNGSDTGQVDNSIMELNGAGRKVCLLLQPCTT